MRRKVNATGKRSRAIAATSGPTPVTSEAEYDINDEVAKLPMGALTIDVQMSDGPKPRRVRPKPFRFLDLPSELRLKVYEHHFSNTGDVLDLDPDNYKRIHQKLAILRVCRTIYREASYCFYSTHPVRIFPTHPGRHFKTKKPLLARMKPGQRASITSLELRLGPGWAKPPRGWVVNPALGLRDCISVTKLTIFVECDPGNDVFKGWRLADGFYEAFSKTLLEGVLDEMPWIQRVEFDAWPSVKKSGALVNGLIEFSISRGLRITWGLERGWTDAEEVEPPPPSPDLNAPLLKNAVNILVAAQTH